MDQYVLETTLRFYETSVFLTIGWKKLGGLKPSGPKKLGPEFIKTALCSVFVPNLGIIEFSIAGK